METSKELDTKCELLDDLAFDDSSVDSRLSYCDDDDGVSVQSALSIQIDTSIAFFEGKSSIAGVELVNRSPLSPPTDTAIVTLVSYTDVNSTRTKMFTSPAKTGIILEKQERFTKPKDKRGGVIHRVFDKMPVPKKAVEEAQKSDKSNVTDLDQSVLVFDPGGIQVQLATSESFWPSQAESKPLILQQVLTPHLRALWLSSCNHRHLSRNQDCWRVFMGDFSRRNLGAVLVNITNPKTRVEELNPRCSTKCPTTTSTSSLPAEQFEKSIDLASSNGEVQAAADTIIEHQRVDNNPLWGLSTVKFSNRSLLVSLDSDYRPRSSYIPGGTKMNMLHLLHFLGDGDIVVSKLSGEHYDFIVSKRNIEMNMLHLLHFLGRDEHARTVSVRVNFDLNLLNVNGAKVLLPGALDFGSEQFIGDVRVLEFKGGGDLSFVVFGSKSGVPKSWMIRMTAFRGGTTITVATIVLADKQCIQMSIESSKRFQDMAVMQIGDWDLTVLTGIGEGSMFLLELCGCVLTDFSVMHLRRLHTCWILKFTTFKGGTDLLIFGKLFTDFQAILTPRGTKG